MSDNSLSNLEKARVISVMDHVQTDDFDGMLYALLTKAEPPYPHEVNDRTRRAISKYVMGAWPHLKSQGDRDGCSIDEIAMGAMTETLLIGYELGRQLQKPLTAAIVKPNREGG